MTPQPQNSEGEILKKKNNDKIVDMVLAQPHTYELMQINPEITMRALKTIEESGEFELFLKLAKIMGLKQEATRSLTSVQELNERIGRVLHTLRIIAHNSKTMGYFCEHLLRSTKRCQAFIRKALAKRRREVEFCKHRWVVTQEKAHRQLDIVVKDRVKRIKSSQSQAVVEDTWGVLIDCYVSTEDMNAAIRSYFKEVSMKYVADFRVYRKESKDAAVASSSLFSTQRKKYREAILKYPAMCQVANLSPSVAELCVHLDHLHNMEYVTQVERPTIDEPTAEKVPALGDEFKPASILPQEIKGAEKPRVDTKPAHVFAPTPTVYPVSYYHAVLTLPPREDFALLLALRGLNSGADPKSLSRVNGPSRQVIERACMLKQKWSAMHGKPYVSSPLNPQGDNQKVDKYGQPKACVDCGSVRRKAQNSLAKTQNNMTLRAMRENPPVMRQFNQKSRTPPPTEDRQRFRASLILQDNLPFNQTFSSTSGFKSERKSLSKRNPNRELPDQPDAVWQMALQNHSARVQEHRARGGGRTHLPYIGS